MQASSSRNTNVELKTKPVRRQQTDLTMTGFKSGLAAAPQANHRLIDGITGDRFVSTGDLQQKRG
jgi:hypothetical protein